MKRLLAKAMALHDKDQHRGVLRVTKRILAEQRQDEAALFYHAYALLRLGQYRRSLQYWKRLKKLNPKQFNLHLNMGVCHHHLGETTLANRCYKQELELYPVSQKALYNLGINYYYAHKYKAAAHFLERCYSQKYSTDAIVCKLAWSYFKTGQADREQCLYEEHLATHPNDTWALNNLGSHLMGQGEYHRALLRLKKAERLDPNDAMVKRNIRKGERLLKKMKQPAV
jgi:Flp pilus assembly protein TadD